VNLAGPELTGSSTPEAAKNPLNPGTSLIHFTRFDPALLKPVSLPLPNLLRRLAPRELDITHSSQHAGSLFL
jgi:hypothetical protein